MSVLIDAFRNYPVMRFAGGVPGTEVALAEERIAALIGFYADKRFSNDWPVYGFEEGEELVGVALVTPHGSTPSATTGRLEATLRTSLGEDTFARVQAFENASDGNEPEGAFDFVGMLAVRPAFQGRGIGRRLLERVKEVACVSGREGVALSTEDPANLPFYEHLGFVVIAHERVEADGGYVLDTWGLAWRCPDPEKPS